MVAEVIRDLRRERDDARDEATTERRLRESRDDMLEIAYQDLTRVGEDRDAVCADLADVDDLRATVERQARELQEATEFRLPEEIVLHKDRVTGQWYLRGVGHLSVAFTLMNYDSPAAARAALAAAKGDPDAR